MSVERRERKTCKYSRGIIDFQRESGKKIEREKADVGGNLREHCLVEWELRNLSTEKKMLNRSVQDMITKAMKDTRVQLKEIDCILNSVVPQFAGLPVRASTLTLAQSEKEVLELCRYTCVNVREWRGRVEECSGKCALEASWSRLIAAITICDNKNWKEVFGIPSK